MINKEPLISVIVPVYNTEQYIQKCVSSITDQTYQNLEILLIDDGSPDNSAQLCDALAEQDERIKVIHQENQGLSGARNTGLTNSSGEYITFVDSDDWIEPNMYEKMLDSARKEEADLVICGHDIFYEGQSCPSAQSNPISIKILSYDEIWEEVFGRLNNAAWNKLYRKSIIADLQFPVGIIHGEDLIFNIHYLCKCKKAVLNNTPMYHYLQRSGSITKSKFSEKKFLEIKSKDMALDLIRIHMPAQEENARKFCFRARMNVIRSIYKAGKEQFYKPQLSELKKYVKEHYASVRRSLRKKERLEYTLFIKSRLIYKLFIKRVLK